MVGVEQNSEAVSTLPTVRQSAGFIVRRGELNDGVGQQTVARYLDYTVDTPDLRYRSAPVVRFGGDGDNADYERVIRAVQLVNTALPGTHKMRVAGDTASSNPGAGIYFNFVSNVDWDYWGITFNSNSGNGNQITHSEININKAYTDNGDRQATIVLAHELLHALGFFGGATSHVPVDLDSVLEATSNIYLERQGQAQPLSILYPADREALRALYAFGRGASVKEFGPWSSTSSHLAAIGEHIAFGSVWRNGYAEPWAYGAQPNTSLANSSLSGSATWEGLLLGWSQGSAVLGDAEINVNLANMNGDAEFTELAHMDTEGQWGDGILVYAIRVNGNTFHQTGGDAGTLTGIFTGAGHEGAAGTLERSDLMAAFGATR